ncbi:MAG: hypothetical protein VX498_05050 [Myxococcota bacterium]|nr:hypothetical protein [Myxococcota bacterium]
MVEDHGPLREVRSAAGGQETERWRTLRTMTHLVFMQCELEHRHQAPHLPMCLYAADLEAAGHRVDKLLVHPSALDDASAWVPPGASMLVLDAVFPFALIRQLKESTGLPVLVGGHNALQHILRGPADLAVVGAGRAALSALAAGSPPHEVPGLWFRQDDGRLDCGPPPASLPNLRTELLPFRPDMDWDYRGPPRAPGSNLRIPSVVAELGCVWNRSILTSRDETTARFYDGVRPRLPDLPLTPRATEMIRRFFVGAEGGCSFCVLRYTQRSYEPPADSLDLLLTQARLLVEKGARGLSIQTEHPLSILRNFLERLQLEGLAERLDEVHIRTIPWLVLRHSDELERCINTAQQVGIQLVLGQVGFEAFDERSLAVFHKGLSPQDNRAAARLLTELDAKHGSSFLGTRGHGLIPLHPWTRPQDLRTNLEACRVDAPWLLPAMSPYRRLELYAEWTPLFWKAWDDKLVRPAPEGFGWDWEFADEGTGELIAAASALLARRRADDPIAAADVLDAVLGIWESEDDPAARGKRYRDLRAC